MMQSKLARKLALACVLTGLAGIAGAQSTTQGAIAGTVFDASNAAVPNATVTIHSEGTNADITLTTGSSGEYKAPLLIPGIYTVTISAPGFEEVRTSEVVVQVNQVTQLNPHLQAGSTGTTVQVTADIPAINFDSPEFGGHLSNQEIENIPINNRRWSSLALTTPGVTNDASGFGLLSFRAISAVLNNVQIDGADDNQAFYGEERGRTRAGYSTSQAAVREFQVLTGVYSTEFGRAVGGVVNSVTKTGTNQLHGEAYFYRRDDAFSAFNPYTTTLVSNSDGTFSSIPYKPKDKRNQYGFGVGGPLVKDKVFWFYAFDKFTRNFPGTARANNPNTFFTNPSTVAGATCTLTGSTAGSYVLPANTTLSSAQLLANQGACLLGARLGTSYASGVAAYNGQLSALAGDLGSVPRYGNQVINTPKINWQITPKHNLSFLYHRMRWDSPGGVQTQATNTYAVDSFGTDFVKLDYGVAKLDSIFGSSVTNEVRYQYGRELNNEGQQPYSDYTKNVLQNPTTGNVSQYQLYTTAGFTLGSPYYSYRVAYPDERKWQIGDTAAYTRGKHSLRFGTDILHNYDLQNNLYEGNGYITYSTNIANFMSDVLRPSGSCNAAGTGVGTMPCYNSYVQGFGPATFQLSTLDYAFFVQDDWKLAPNFALNLGVRYDYESLPSPFSGLQTLAQTGNHPSDKNNISPRVGFAWDPYGKGKTVLRGGFGIYYGRIPNAVLLNAYENTGSANSQTTYSLTPSSSAPRFREQLASRPTSTGGNVYYLDKNLQNPSTYQMDLAVQQDLGKNNVLSVQYLGALGRELPNYINTNIDPTKTYTVNYHVASSNGSCGVLNCETITNQVYAGRQYVGGSLTSTGVVPITGYNGVTDVLSNINSNYHALSIDVTNRTFKWVTFDANYTWAHALDFSQNQFTSASINNWIDPFANQRLNYGNSSLDVRQRAVGWAILNIPGVHSKGALSYLTNGWSLKPLVQAQTGLPYSATVSGSTPQQCYVTSSNCYASSSATSTGLLGTGVTYIPQIGRNTFKQPRAINIDLRAQKDLKLYERLNLQLIAEAFNLANHQNVTAINSGAYTLSTNTSNAANPVATLTPTNNFGTASATNGSYAYRERQFQFAARVTF